MALLKTKDGQIKFPTWVKKMKENLSRTGDDRYLADENGIPLLSPFDFMKIENLVGHKKKIENSVFIDYFSEMPEIYWRLYEVCEDYGSVRFVNPDSDSFYRSFAFSYFELMLKNSYEAAAAGLLVQHYQMKGLGPNEETKYPKFRKAVELTAEFIIGLEYGDLNMLDILELMNDPEKSGLVIWFFRWLTTNQILIEKSFYDPVMKHLDINVTDYIQECLATPGKAADPIQIGALASATGMHVRVEFVEPGVTDTAEEEAERRIILPGGSRPNITILSFLGTFDVLYRRRQTTENQA